MQVDDTTIVGFQPADIDAALLRSGFHPQADPARVNRPVAFLVLFALAVMVAMVYGPIAAFLVGLFPAHYRYTAFSLPYHIGNGVFGGVLPLVSAALVAYFGDIFAGLYYPVTVAGITAIVGAFFLRRRRQRRRG